MINLFGVDLHLYGLLIALGIWVAFEVSLKLSRRRGISVELIQKAFWWVVIGGVIGARVYHVVDFWGEYYRYDLVKSLYLWEGGLGIWGAVVGGVMGLLLFTKQQKIFKKKFLRLLDVTMVGVPLGQAVGRLGNWANGELYGKNGEPLFAFEALLNLGLFLVLWKMGRKKMSTSEVDIFAGRIAGGYLVGYGLIRIFSENFRPEEIIWKWQGVPVAVIMGIISLLVGGVIWRKRP